MKPRILKIRGLNSFIEEQVIDFSKLTEKGLFGIFGTTGSGKSTILDAITIALYGSIAREAREFMNTYCDSLSVSYEFEIGVGNERKIYYTERLLVRDKTGSYKSKRVVLIEKMSPKDNVIAEGVSDVKENIEKILGLTSEDFTRSVVLPQGKFSEFLKLTGKDRRNMLERLFGLEKFGRKLGDKVRAVKKVKNDELNVVIGRVKNYEDKGISEEKFAELKSKLKTLEAERDSIKENKDRLDAQYELNKNIWELQKELQEYKAKEVKLIEEAPVIEVKKEQLKTSQNAWIVKPYSDAVNDTSVKIKFGEEKVKTLRIREEQLSIKLVETEKQYKEIVQRKEKELPLLIEKETNISRAMEVLQKLTGLEKEREELVQQYNSKINTLKQCTTNLEACSQKLKDTQQEKVEVEKKLEETLIEPQYRDDVNRLVALMEEHEKLEASVKELNSRREKRQKLIAEVDEQWKNIVSKKDESFKEIAITEEKMIEVMASTPPDNKVLFETKENIFKFDKLIADIKVYEEKKEALDKELVEVESKSEEILARYKQMNDEWQKNKSDKESLEDEIKELERKNLAAVLAEELEEGNPCPVCGSVHHPAPVLSVNKEDIISLQEKKDSLQKQLEAEEKELKQLEVKLATLNKNKEYILNQLTPLKEQYEEISLDNIIKQKEGLEQQFEKLNKDIEQWNKDKEHLEKQLGNMKEQKSKIEQDEVKLSEKLKAERLAEEENIQDIKGYEAKKVPIIQEIELIRQKYNIEDAVRIQANIKNSEKINREQQVRLKKFNDLITAANESKEKLQTEKSSCEVEIARILEGGKEKRNIIDKEKEYLNQLSEGRDVFEYKKEVAEKKEDIIKKEAEYKESYDSSQKESSAIKEALLKEVTENNALIIQYQQQQQVLNEQLSLYNFNFISEIEGKLLSKEVMNSIERQIADYENNLKNIAVNVERINEKLGGRTIDNDQWNSIISNRELMKTVFEEKIKEIAGEIQKLSQIEKDLEEFKVLQKKRKELEHICSNLDDIAKLIEGNRFVEFVALNQLKYICIEASKRLKNITGGRYALEIDASGNFIMRDDFNGGARRATGTLSGGETFLTSLCLALALSSQIQLKGSAPLEFFFLDEGFGTLDSDLLDTVMNSLEKLYSDKLCVGIISHVEELKSRVPVKLLVEPAESGLRGSRVKIELS